MTRYIVRHAIAAAVLLLLSTSLSFGASVSISAQGNGVFTVRGDNMDGVAGIDLTLNYDTPALGSPSVSQGALVLASGAMFAANPTYSKNSIKIAVVSTKSFSGSGPVATITFATHTGTGTVTITNFNPVNSSGASVSGSITNGSASDFTTTTGTSSTDTSSTGTTTTGTSSTDTSSTGTTTTGGTTTGSSNPTYLGTVTMPSDSQSQNGAKPAPGATAPAQTPEAAAKSAETAATAATPASETPAANEAATTVKTKKTDTISIASSAAVLERFRVYRGEKTPAILIALFKQQISATIRQEPFVAPSDGTTTVTIVVDLSAEPGASPNFALNGAKMISLKKDDASPTWSIKALPAKGALNASLMILNENHVSEYPLTITPLIKNVATTEAEFAAFLKNAAKTPAQHDLNGDSTYDGIDDYIYTANYLVRQQQAKPAAK